MMCTRSGMRVFLRCRLFNRVITIAGMSFSFTLIMFYGVDLSSEQYKRQPSQTEAHWECSIWPGYNCNSGETSNVNQLNFLNHYAKSTAERVRSSKRILLVVPDYEVKQGGVFIRRLTQQNCPISDCTITLDSDRNWRTADAVIIGLMNATTLKQYLPKPAHQIWIARSHESPFHNMIETAALGHYVNWSISYHPDAHIVEPYGIMAKRQLKLKRIVENFAVGRTKQVAWVVSNCGVKNGRAVYANELSRYIGVDIYGECVNRTCEIEEYICFKTIARRYKFYLAFENSNCNYYITEKLFRNAFGYNLLPIVMGARPQDYAATAPPHSYIHVDEFRTPRQLADYLHMLDKNDTAYNEYFQWKAEWQHQSPSYSTICRVCGLIHAASELNYVHWYDNYTLWWDGDQVSTCDRRKLTHTGLRWLSWNGIS